MELTAAESEEWKEYKREYPEEAQAAMEEGAEQERDRWRGIEAVAKDLGPMHAPLVKAMKADGRCTGGDLAQAALAMTRPSNSQADQSLDRVAVQRQANQDWVADPCLRQAFNKNQRMFTEYRVALAKAA